MRKAKASSSSCVRLIHKTGEIHAKRDDAHAERCYFFLLFHIWLIAVVCISTHCSWPFSFEFDTDVFSHGFFERSIGILLSVWILLHMHITFNFCLPLSFGDFNKTFQLDFCKYICKINNQYRTFVEKKHLKWSHCAKNNFVNIK